MAENQQLTQQDIITAEQQELSMLLLKLLYKIYTKKSLEIDAEEPPVVTAYYAPTEEQTKKQKSLPSKMRLYDIWCETYSDTNHYWLRVQDGTRRLVEFGRFQNDGTFFSDNDYDYLAALYDLRTRPNSIKNTQQQSLSNKTKLALKELENQKPKPDLHNFTAWDESRINVLLHLKDILRG